MQWLVSAFVKRHLKQRYKGSECMLCIKYKQRGESVMLLLQRNDSGSFCFMFFAYQYLTVKGQKLCSKRVIEGVYPVPLSSTKVTFCQSAHWMVYCCHFPANWGSFMWLQVCANFNFSIREFPELRNVNFVLVFLSSEYSASCLKTYSRINSYLATAMER